MPKAKEKGRSSVYSDLAWGNLITLLVQVDKENSIEFSFNCGTLLIHLLCLLLFKNSCTSPFGHSILYIPNFLIKRKEKKKKINNDLAVFGCVMTLFPVWTHWLSLSCLFPLLCFFLCGAHCSFSSPFLFLYCNVWTLPFAVPSSPTSKTLYFLHHFLPPHFYLLP